MQKKKLLFIANNSHGEKRALYDAETENREWDRFFRWHLRSYYMSSRYRKIRKIKLLMKKLEIFNPLSALILQYANEEWFFLHNLEVVANFSTPLQ